MSSYCGNIKFTVFGQSHSPAIGVTAEGLPAGFEPDMEELSRFMARRAPGQNLYSTQRREADKPEFISGLFEGRLTGAPLTAVIANTDTRSKDYSELRIKPRPGHADFTALTRFGDAWDNRGGGEFSGRLTAPLCIVGGLCLQLLEREGISVISRIAEIGGICDEGELLCSTADKDFPVVSDEAGERMKAAILSAKSELDSLGGIIECAVPGVPAGLGGAMLDGMEGRIAQLVFGIPAVKGVEFGAGFAAARMRGSENNDPFRMEGDRVVTATNNCGGILGGITNGMPLVFRAAIKPTPSIAREQDTVDLSTGENTKLVIRGRHDPCIVPRAVPCIEAAAAIAIYDALTEEKKK
ncbi:MAG: chorismate synthase [Oscillospiraceae bacterium]|nr:chorismate synthase [Oscillospiraceae bacterium]